MSQFVSKGSDPSNIPVEHGAPQGSYLGRLLFSLYTSPLSTLLCRSHLPDMLINDSKTEFLIIVTGQNYLMFKLIASLLVSLESHFPKKKNFGTWLDNSGIFSLRAFNMPLHFLS